MMTLLWARKSLNPLTPVVFCAAVTLVLSGGALRADPPAPKAKDKQAAAKPAALDPVLQEAIKTAPAGADWPNSNYARLLDLGNVTVKSDGTVVAEYRVTYKLFNERARALAEVNLPYNSSYQSVKILQARTIKKDGTVQPVKPADIRTSSPYSDYLMYDDAMAVGFSMPGIEDDCILDYTFQETTRPLLMPGQFWNYWGFSGVEPVGLCRYVLTAPADKALHFKVYNDEALKPTVVASKDGRSKVYTWEMRNIAPISPEPEMPPLHEVSVWMELSSMDSWQDLAKWFWGLAKPQIAPNSDIKATVERITADKKTEDEKARAIYDWVANRTRYVGLEFGISAFKPHAASEVHEKLYGDCKDKATLLISMLGVAGIKAYPVLLSAGSRSPVAGRLPTLTAFNHCIALADVSGKPVWLDATAETCAYGDIPDGDRGVQALVVRENAGEFETIPRFKPEENGVDMGSTIDLKPDGSAEAKIELSWIGGAGQSWRAAVKSLTPDKRKEMLQGMVQSFSTGAALKDYNLPDGRDKDGPLVMKLTATAPSWAKRTGKLLVLPIANWKSDEERRNPFTQDKRVFPIVDEDTSRTKSITTIRLPEGYVVDDLPDDVHLQCPLQDYVRTVAKSADGRTLTITETSSEWPGKVAAAEYGKMKTYYESLLRVAEDQIVLKRQ